MHFTVCGDHHRMQFSQISMNHAHFFVRSIADMQISYYVEE